MREGDFFIPRFPQGEISAGDSVHPSQMARESKRAIAENSYLHLKPGVTLRQQGTSYTLGLPTHGICIEEPLQVQMVRSLNGRQTLREISRGLMWELPLLIDFAHTLSEAGLIDETPLPLELPSPKNGDLSAELMRARLSAELSLLTHRTSHSGGGRDEFADRAHFRILISGETRLARHLLVAMHASGFTSTRLIPRAHLPHHLTSDDVCGIVVRPEDIGKLRSAFTDDLIRGAQISKPEVDAGVRPDLIISTVPIEWDYIQRWMSEGSLHLQINQIIGREIEIGPLVMPGRDPCLRCVRLTKGDNGTDVSHEYIRSQAPTAAISYISGLIALAIGEYFATGESLLRATSHWYDLLAPLRAPDIRHWNFHPECGCQ